MLDMISATLIFTIGLLVGYTFGALRAHATFINYFREYYRRQAEAQIRNHINLLISQMQSFGAALDGHRRAATEAFDGGGRHGFRFFSIHIFRARFRARRKGVMPISPKTRFH